MSSMFNPPHPGLTLRDDILPALNLQVGEDVYPLRRDPEKGVHAIDRT